MPRQPRLHVPGGHYHVVLRGNHREALFSTDGDRNVLDDIVADALPAFGARLHAYCWMTNHLHTLVQIADRPLGKLMQRIAVRYSRHRHRTLQTAGHLFERRHRAKLIDVDRYFHAVLRYIHLNPVNAGVVKDAADYPWCSHRAYLGLEGIPWVTTEFGLSLFSTDRANARAAYAAFMRTGVPGDDLDVTVVLSDSDSRVIGADEFVERIRPPDQPRSSLTLAQLAETICNRHGIPVSIIRSPAALRLLTPIRVEIARSAIEQRVATLAEVARYLDRDPSTLYQLMNRHLPIPH
ncbi:MAG TPA: transposase [Steroidobacteraceae bacterium]|nr:transposase [Steroidobacteraceae bacterium]